MLTGAPVTFTLACLLIVGLVWVAMRWRYGGVVETLEARLVGRDDKIKDYQEKLEGASPDEAKARIDALESRLQRLEPRRIEQEECDTAREILSKFSGAVAVTQDMQSPDARPLSITLAGIFQSAGWDVSSPAVLGPANPPVEGIAVTIHDLNNPSDRDRAIFEAMDAIGHPYGRRGGLNSREQLDAEILVTSQV